MKPAQRLPLQASDLRGLAQLGVDGVLGITDLVEAMHHTIASRASITRLCGEAIAPIRLPCGRLAK